MCRVIRVPDWRPFRSTTLDFRDINEHKKLVTQRKQWRQGEVSRNTPYKAYTLTSVSLYDPLKLCAELRMRMHDFTIGAKIDRVLEIGMNVNLTNLQRVRNYVFIMFMQESFSYRPENTKIF